MNGSKNGLRFDAVVTLGHVLQIVAMLSTIVLAWHNLDKRVSILEYWKAEQDAIQHKAEIGGPEILPRDFREMIPATPPVDHSQGRRQTHAAIGHYVIQVGTSFAASSYILDDIDAEWIRIETDIPVDVLVDEVLVTPGYYPPGQLKFLEASEPAHNYQSPLAWEYTGSVSRLRIVPREQEGTSQVLLRGLVHVYWSKDSRIRVGRGRPIAFVWQGVALAGWNPLTRIDFRPVLNNLLAPATVNEMWPLEIEVTSIGFRSTTAGGFQLISAAILWRDPTDALTLREHVRVGFDFQSFGAGSSGGCVELADPVRIPLIGEVREPGGIFNLKLELSSNGFVAPDDTLVYVNCRAV